MPWCEPCEVYLTPNSVATDGSCPRCGEEVAEASDAEDAAFGPARTGTPWHFKLLVVAAALYLGWRLVEAIVWVIQAVF